MTLSEKVTGMGCFGSKVVSPEQAADKKSEKMTIIALDEFEKWKLVVFEFSDSLETFQLALAHWIDV